MSLNDAVNRFYYEMTISELRLVNETEGCPEITHNSLLYLDLIAYTEDCTASYIASTLGVSKPAVTAKLGELMKQGLVTKRQSTEDRRINYLSVSNEVMNNHLKYDKIMAKAIDDVGGRYSAAELDAFGRILVDLSISYSAEQQKETRQK